MDFPTFWMKHKAKVFIGIALVFIGLIINYLYNHSFISITVNNPSGSEITYTILNQRNNQSTEIKTKKTTIKKYVSRSQYEIKVGENSRNSWNEIDSGSFLSTKNVPVTLEKERDRTFIGSSPAGCMTRAEILLSTDCDGPLSALKRHIPGTNETPPFVLEGVEGLDNNPEYVAATKQGTIAFVSVSETGEFDEADEGSPVPQYYIAKLQNDGQKATEVREITIDPTPNRHTVLPYKEGFIIYDNNFSNFYYLANFNAQPKKITLPKTDSGLAIKQVSTSDSYITVSYSNYEENKNNSTPSLQKGIKSQVYLLDENGVIKSYSFNTYWNKAIACGTEKLCLLSIADKRNQVNIYDITSNKARYLYSVNNAKDIFTSGSILKVINENSVLSIDVDKRVGAVDYTFKKSAFCGFTTNPQDKDYVLCITDVAGKNNAVLIKSSSSVTVSIDDIVNGLIEKSYIDTIIPDRNRLYIVPNYGNLVFVEGSGFTNDPEVVKDIDLKIRNDLAETKLKESGYTLIQPGTGIY